MSKAQDEFEKTKLMGKYVNSFEKFIGDKTIEELMNYDPIVDLPDFTVSNKTMVINSILLSVQNKGKNRLKEYAPNIMTNNSLEKACWYHFSNTKFDYDVCLYNMLLYKMIFAYVSKGRTLQSYDKEANKFQWKSEDDLFTYRGDTMNSFNTPIIEYIRLFGDDKDNPRVCAINQKGRNIGKFCVPSDAIEIGWYDFILNNLDYFSGQVFSKHAMDYIRVYHSIGNFIPVPFVSANNEFNRPRGCGLTKDFWDLCLFYIYRWFKSGLEQSERDDEYLRNILQKDENVILCKLWLVNDFGSWEKFVISNFLEDFCDDNLFPIELWEGHFIGDVVPTKKWQFEQFFENAARMINTRSKRICKYIKCNYGEK